MTRTLAAACQYLHAGFSLIPLKADGSKAPAIPAWKAYQTQRPTETEINIWFGTDTPRGIGLIHGAVSATLKRWTSISLASTSSSPTSALSRGWASC